MTITAFARWEIGQNLTIFYVSFLVKGIYEGTFLLKLQAVFYQLQFYQRRTSFAGVFFTKMFDKKCRPIIFKWLLLFAALTQAVFTKKVCFMEIASFNYSSTET